MKNIQEVLREKEVEIDRLTREIKLLRVAARILDEETQRPADSKAHEVVPSFEEPVLEVVRSTQGPANGEAAPNKRWP